MKTYQFKRKHSIEGKVSDKNLIITDRDITFKEDIILNIAHRKKDYAFPIKALSTFEIKHITEPHILYFEVSPISGEISMEQTLSLDFARQYSANELPQNPEYGRLIFDLNDMVMKRWNGAAWADVIGVALGILNNGALEQNFVGKSQANIPAEVISSEIVFDRDHQPIRIQKTENTEFLTEKEREEIGFRKVSTLSFDNVLHEHRTKSDIPEFTVVARDDDSSIKQASISGIDEGVGLTLYPSGNSQNVFLVERGFLTNSQWRWADTPGTSLFFDKDGQLTTHSPIQKKKLGENVFMAQKVGHIVDIDTIFFSPEKKYIL